MNLPFTKTDRRYYIGLYGKLFLTFLALLTALAAGYGYLTAYSAIRYFEATYQRLNREVAAHIVRFTEPFLDRGVNQAGADAIFFNTMVTNPSAEVYLLDTTGRILLFHAPASKIRRNRVPLAPIRQFIATQGQTYVRGDDPRSDGGDQKIFSAAAVYRNDRLQGYVYVILGGEDFGSAMNHLLKSHALLWILLTMLLTLGAALLTGLVLLYPLSRGMNAIVGAVRRFRQGDFLARVPVPASRDMALVADTFNDMATTLASNIETLTRSERLRRELVANIAHDLRTPITAMYGYATALTTADLPPVTQQKYAGVIARGTEKLIKLVDELAELAKLEARETVAQPEPFAIADLLSEVIARFALLAEQNSLVLRCINCQLPIFCYADVGLMERVLQNLLENAVKSTPAGGMVQVALEQPTADYLAVVVTNETGPLSYPVQAYLSNPARTDVPNQPPITGLGLSIVAKILALHYTQLQVTHQSPDTLRIAFALPVYRDEPVRY